MAIEWNVPEDVPVVYRYSGGAWTKYLYYQTDDGIDIFVDNFAVGDAIYFINNGEPWQKSHGHKFAGLQVVVDTAVQAATYSYVWEYQDDQGNWVALPNVNDPSNGFQNTGTHNITWDVPSNWKNSYKPCNNDYYSSGFVVRLRVTDVSNPTEGGKFGITQTIKQFNYAYTISDGNTYTPNDLYQKDQELGNNLIDKISNYYKVNANVIIRNGKLYIAPNVTLEVGTLTQAYNITGGFEIIANGDVEIEGGKLLWNNSYYQGRYNYWTGSLKMSKGARLRKCFGGYVAWTIACVLDVEDSQIESYYHTDTLYFHANARGSVRRSNIITYNFYMYTGKVSWIDVQQKTLGQVTTNYQLLGGTSNFRITFDGFDFRNSITLTATQGAEMWMINPRNFNPTKMSLGNTYGSYNNAIFICYELDLTVIDENSNPIEGAKVFVRDKNGHTALWKNWLQTDGWAVYSFTSDTDTTAYFRKYNSEFTSYTVQKPTFLNVGDYIRLRGEYLKITALNDDGTFTADRNQTYNGYISIGYPCRYSIVPLMTEVDYLITDSNGKVKFTGEFGSFNPVLVTVLYIEDKNDNRQDRDYAPFTLTVKKYGYKDFQITMDLSEKANITAIMQPDPFITKDELSASSINAVCNE